MVSVSQFLSMFYSVWNMSQVRIPLRISVENPGVDIGRHNRFEIR